MSLTKEQIQAVFRSSVAEEFRQIPPEDAIAYTFSEDFVKKSEDLPEKSSRKRMSAIKRVAVAAFAVLAVFVSAFGVKAVRGPVSRFITEAYEHCLYVLIEGKMHITIETVYQLAPIPEGYTIVGCIGNGQIVQTIYRRGDGALLVLEQTTAAAGVIPMDTEKGTLRNLTVHGVPVLVYESAAYTQIYWVMDNYCFGFTHNGDISTQTLLDLISSVQP